jgi:hypothetical protein
MLNQIQDPGVWLDCVMRRKKRLISPFFYLFIYDHFTLVSNNMLFYFILHKPWRIRGRILKYWMRKIFGIVFGDVFWVSLCVTAPEISCICYCYMCSVEIHQLKSGMMYGYITFILRIQKLFLGNTNFSSILTFSPQVCVLEFFNYFSDVLRVVLHIPNMGFRPVSQTADRVQALKILPWLLRTSLFKTLVLFKRWWIKSWLNHLRKFPFLFCWLKEILHGIGKTCMW